MSGRILQSLVSTYDPDEDTRPRHKPTFADRVERGAMAIYGAVTNTYDPDKLAEKWARVAKPITKDRHRAEAEACLRAAN